MTGKDDSLQIRELIYNSPDYKQELELRDNVLRKPLGMSLSDDNLEADSADVRTTAQCHAAGGKQDRPGARRIPRPSAVPQTQSQRQGHFPLGK